MRSLRVPVRALPSLSPVDLARSGVGPVSLDRRPFPFGDPHTRLLFLGRNAVWRGVSALGLSGRTVLMPAYHHGVEVQAVLAAGARVVFYRVDPGMRPDLDQVRDLLREERAAALYVTHFLGWPQPSAELRALAREAGALLVEDCALSLFSEDAQGVPLGSGADAAIFCLYKTLPVPDGGALLMPGALDRGPPSRPPPWGSTLAQAGSSLVDRCAGRGWPRLANLARTAHREAKRHFDVRSALGNAAVGTDLLEPGDLDLGISRLARSVVLGLCAPRARDLVERRRRNFEIVAGALCDESLSALPRPPKGACPLFFPVRVRDGSEKDALIAALAARGVEAVNFWRIGHPSCERGRFPEVEVLRETVVEVPLHQDLDDEAAHDLGRRLTGALSQVRRVGSRAGGLRVEILAGEAALRALEAPWTALLAARPPRTLFRSWPVARAWWAHLGVGDPRLVVAREKGEVVAIVPMVEDLEPLAPGLARRRWRLFGAAANFADHLGIVARPGEAHRLAPALAEAIAGPDGPDVVFLEDLDAEDPLAPALAGRLAAEGREFSLDDDKPCPYAILGEEYAARLARRPGGLAAQVARRRRWLAGRPGFSYEAVGGGARLHPALDELIDLHRARWGEQSRTFEGRARAMHHELLDRLAREGAVALRLLHAEGAPRAAVYGLRWGDGFAYLQSGHDPAWKPRRPGIALLGMLVDECRSQGVREIDFLRGSEAYKDDWADRVRVTRSLRFAGTGPRAGALGIAAAMRERGLAVARAARGILRRVGPGA